MQSLPGRGLKASSSVAKCASDSLGGVLDDDAASDDAAWPASAGSSDVEQPPPELDSRVVVVVRWVGSLRPCDGLHLLPDIARRLEAIAPDVLPCPVNTESPRFRRTSRSCSLPCGSRSRTALVGMSALRRLKLRDVVFDQTVEGG